MCQTPILIDLCATHRVSSTDISMTHVSQRPSCIVPEAHVQRAFKVCREREASDFHYSDGDAITPRRNESTSQRALSYWCVDAKLCPHYYGAFAR